MPSTISETLYDVAFRAIEEQEREVASLRARTGTLVAAAAVAATLLVRSVFAGIHPHGWVAWCMTAAGLQGLAVVLIASIYLLRSHDLSFSIDASAALEELLGDEPLGDDDSARAHVHGALTYRLSDMQAENALTVSQLRVAFAAALAGLVVEIVGLGLAAALA
ncbi:MAG TPA: hypothetical protein VGO80_23835 [Solirubrobacteraceae bacterium]|jgi:hypothetical protein|nr:hypothetical protein [Solirubrobacteraceae bacterium]